jgi:tetratricopeptide (TPR) repeat protein
VADTQSAQVRLLSLSVLGSLPGDPGPLPALTPVRGPTTTRVSDEAPADMMERVARGRILSPLPYGVLSDYDRADHALEVPAIELGNGRVRALVLPSLGGRVWSLTDEVNGRELVHRNPRLRWANFGLTDAWFAGGIEWNLGSTGHSTTSNLPMHAAVLDTPLGPVVRLWEWERTRDLVLQIDLWLCGARLMTSTRVVNPDPAPKPLYYWTNIAVPETPGTRVLVPASSAWRTDYAGVLERVSVPFPDGPVDVSVPSASRYAADYFYEVGDQAGRLVCAVEPDGRGIAQTSTDALHGRKLFLWGHGPGGQRWQDWLGVRGARYLEIQAGVCPTQLEHDLLDGDASRTWTEAFVPLDLDPSLAAGDYATAAQAARAAVHEAAGPAWLEEQHSRWLAEVADVAPGELVHTGSGWGRAELSLRGARGPVGTPFPEVDDDSLPLLRFAEQGDPTALERISPDRSPLPVVSDRWMARLADVAGRGAGWWAHYALGTARHVRGDLEGAHAAYRRSTELLPSAWALRGLALLSEDTTERAELYEQASALAPDDRRLAVERLVSLRDTGQPEGVVAAVAALPDALRAHGRTRMLLADSLARLGEDQAALEILEDLEVPDLAEGDRTLAEVWEQLRPGEPVPPRLDFRMSPGSDDDPAA